MQKFHPCAKNAANLKNEKTIDSHYETYRIVFQTRSPYIYQIIDKVVSHKIF